MSPGTVQCAVCGNLLVRTKETGGPGAVFCSVNCLHLAAAGFDGPPEVARRPGPERVEDMREQLERFINTHPDVRKLQEALEEALRMGNFEQAQKIQHVLTEFVTYLGSAYGGGLAEEADRRRVVIPQKGV